MRRNIFGSIAYLALGLGVAFAQNATDDEICIDFFGVGALVDEKCNPFSGLKRKIGPSELATALADGVVDLKIVSDDRPDEPYVLAPLSNADDVHSLKLFRVGDIDLTPVQEMRGLRRLDLSVDAALALGQLTSELDGLLELRLYAPRRTVDISALSRMPNLRVLYVKAQTVTGQESLSSLTHLEHATFQLEEETDFAPISSLTQLKKLEISGSLGRSVVSSITFVAPLTSLKHLELSGNSIEDLSPLSGLRGLTLLILSRNSELSDISALSGITGLRTLQLRNTNVSDLTPLQGLKELGILWLDRTPVADISVLADLPNLWGLELSRTQVTDISALSRLPLEHLSLRGTNVTDYSSVPAGAKLQK